MTIGNRETALKKACVVMIVMMSGGLWAQACSTEHLHVRSDVGGMAHTAHGSAFGQIAARYDITDHVFVDAAGRTGAALRTFPDQDQLYVALLSGVGLSTGHWLDAWKLHVSARFAHIHHASVESWGETPGANIGGTSSGGVEHRSGAEFGLGTQGPALYVADGGFTVGWNAELLAQWLPASPELSWGLGGMLGLNHTRW